MEWFKFYHNKWLSDLSIGRLTPEDRLCFITLLCIATQCDERDGVVMRVSEHEIITLTRLPVDIYDDEKSSYHNAIGCLDRMEKEGLIKRCDGETIIINNYVKRQNSHLTTAERSKRYRLKKSKVTNVTQKSDERHEREEKRREEKSIHNTSEETSHDDVVKVVDEFKKWNKTASKWYGNKTQRAASKRLIENYGLETIIQVVSVLPQTNKMKYIPTVTTPLQLEDKWEQLKARMQQKKEELTTKVIW